MLVPREELQTGTMRSASLLAEYVAMRTGFVTVKRHAWESAGACSAQGRGACDCQMVVQLLRYLCRRMALPSGCGVGWRIAERHSS